MKYSYTFLTKAYQNKNAVFVATGLILPFFLFIFRTCLWYNNWFILLYLLFGYITINRIVEPILFCYLPTFIIYCFISTKPASWLFFIQKFIKKKGLTSRSDVSSYTFKDSLTSLTSRRDVWDVREFLISLWEIKESVRSDVSLFVSIFLYFM